MGRQSGGAELLNSSQALGRGAAVAALPQPGTAAGCSVLALTVRPPSELIHLASLRRGKTPTKQNKPQILSLLLISSPE